MLIGHWPLNGHLNDISGNNNPMMFSNPSSVAIISDNTDGMLGSSFTRPSTNNGADFLTTTKTFPFNTGKFTLMTWVKVIDYTGLATASGAVTFHSHSPQTGVCIDVTDVLGMSVGLGTTRPITRLTNAPLTKEKWYHVAVRYDGTLYQTFLDGVMVDSRPYNIVFQPEKLSLFSWSNTYNGSNNYRPACSLNDVRLYDDCLSTKEIKEIKKLKVLHYTFDNPHIEPTNNLVSFQNITISSLQVGVTGTKTEEGYKLVTADNYLAGYTFGTARINFPLEILTNGETYTLSLRYKIISGNPELRFSDWGDSSLIQRYSYNEGDYIVEVGTGVRAAYTSTYKFMDFFINSGCEILITHIQLEVGNRATPFVNGIRTSGLIYDCSGFGNHGSQGALPPKIVSDSVIGSHAIQFEGTDKTSAVSLGTNLPHLIKQLSISAWIKYEGTPAGGVFVKGDAGTWAANTFMFLRVTSNYYRIMFTDGTSTIDYNTPASLGDNEWHHIVTTFDENYFIVYIDGVQKSKKVNTLGTLNPATNKMSYLGAGYNLTRFNGLIDDLRMYATALSEEEVLELYNVKASFDSSGNIYVNELNNPVKIKKAIEIPPNGGTHSADFYMNFKPNKDIIIKTVKIRPYFTGDLVVVLKNSSYETIRETKNIAVFNGVVQKIDLNMYCKAGEYVLLGRKDASTTPLMRSTIAYGSMGEFSTEDIEFYTSTQTNNSNSANQVYYFFEWDYEIIEDININKKGILTFTEINQIDIESLNENIKHKFTQDGTIYLKNSIIQV